MAASQCETQEPLGKLKLYSYWRSSCSWRVRTALAFKGIPYEYKAINILKGEHLSEEFTKLNPFQMVPALVDGDLIVSDSFAILEYLEEKYPKPSLLPSDIKKRALVREAVNGVVSSIQPLQNTGVLGMIEGKLGSEERIKWAQYYIEKGFIALERLLKETAGKCCIGDEFSFADVVLVPQVANAVGRFQIDMDQFPTLKKLDEALRELPWVQESSPEKQPDAPI